MLHFPRALGPATTLRAACLVVVAASAGGDDLKWVFRVLISGLGGC